MTNFPNIKSDSAKFSEMAVQDPAMSVPLEAGYVATRPRFTRRPRRSFKLGFTLLTKAQKEELQAFWEDRLGGSRSFVFTHPENGTNYTVRFKQGYTPEFKYVGMGPTVLYNCDGMILEEV